MDTSEGAQRVNESRPQRRYLTWTADEDRMLLEEYESGVGLKELARKRERSLGAIKSRLLHLGRLPR